MKLLNSKELEAIIIDFAEEDGFYIIQYKCPHCFSQFAIISKKNKIFHETCSDCKKKFIILKQI
jgi:transposase-like protein